MYVIFLIVEVIRCIGNFVILKGRIIMFFDGKCILILERYDVDDENYNFMEFMDNVRNIVI